MPDDGDGLGVGAWRRVVSVFMPFKTKGYSCCSITFAWACLARIKPEVGLIVVSDVLQTL